MLSLVCLVSLGLTLIFLEVYVRVYALLLVCQSLHLEMCVGEVNRDSTQTLLWTQNYIHQLPLFDIDILERKAFCTFLKTLAAV